MTLSITIIPTTGEPDVANPCALAAWQLNLEGAPERDLTIAKSIRAKPDMESPQKLLRHLELSSQDDKERGRNSSLNRIVLETPVEIHQDLKAMISLEPFEARLL